MEIGKRRRESESDGFPSKKTKYDDNNVFRKIKNLIKRPEEFALASETLQNELLQLLQLIYQYGKNTEPKSFSPLSSLVVEDMDLDQIWEQIQLLNKPLLKYANSLSLDQPTSDSSDNDELSDISSDLSEISDYNQNDNDQIDDRLSSSGDEAAKISGGESENENENEALEDDPFFDLDEMEAFIEDGERRAELGSEGDDEEMLEYLNQSDLSESDSEDGGIDWDKMKEEGDVTNKSEIRFDDFFEAPPKLSKYQKRKQELKDKIESLEEINIADKPWQLKGEVSGESRPKDSLLEEYVIFDHATKTAPAITVEKTQDLEDIIKQRIREESWDDVLPRKVLAEDGPVKKLEELDHEKSKHGLAEVYERQYLGLDSEEAERQAKEKYEEITAIFNSVCYKLDALSNFHYTPRQVKRSTVEEKKNVPAINMEEKLPSTVSDGSLLAPEEVYAPKKKPIKGDTEMTSEEKQAKRRAKKAALRKQKKAEEADRKVVEKLNPGLGNKYTKQAAIDNLKQLRKAKNVQFASKTSGDISYTQSTAFFSKLQQDAQSEITKVKESGKKKKAEKKTSAHSLKL